MNFIAGNENEWTIRGTYEALFNYCFPLDFKDCLWAQLSSATQGKHQVRDFIRDIEKLVARFPGVNEQAVIQTYWNGVHQHIRLRLIEWGISLEHTSLERIIRKSIAIEASDEAYQREMWVNKVAAPK